MLRLSLLLARPARALRRKRILGRVKDFEPKLPLLLTIQEGLKLIPRNRAAVDDEGILIIDGRI